MPIGPRYSAFQELGHGVVDIPGRFLMRVMAIVGSAMAILRAMLDPSVRTAAQDANYNHPNIPLSPAEVAAGVLKGVVAADVGADEARYSGVSPERFDALVAITGNPPGPMQLLDQWRRKLIDTTRFRHGLRQGFLKDEWIDFFENLRHEPLSATQYLQGAVEGHIGLDEAKAIADGLGLIDRDAQLVFDTLGNPPGIVEMGHLWLRGKISESEYDQAIRESHYKDKYIPAIKAYTEYFPPPRTITTLLSHGAITDQTAMRLFQQAGLSHELATAYVASALHVKTASHKELTVSNIRQLFGDHLITEQAALDDLARIGYGGGEARLLLDLAKAEAARKVRQEAIQGVRHVYLARRIDAVTADADLARFGIDEEQRRSLLDLWELQRLTPSKSLTVGQLNKAFKGGIINRAEFLQRVEDLGYTPGDAAILAELDVPMSAGDG